VRRIGTLKERGQDDEHNRGGARHGAQEYHAARKGPEGGWVAIGG
jgi:hypothetical protein